jgi:hypothetical protein
MPTRPTESQILRAALRVARAHPGRRNPAGMMFYGDDEPCCLFGHAALSLGTNDPGVIYGAGLTQMVDFSDGATSDYGPATKHPRRWGTVARKIEAVLEELEAR